MIIFRKKVSMRVYNFLILVPVLFLLAGCASGPQQKAADDAGPDEPSSLTRIESVTTEEDADHYNVVISGNGPLTYTAVKQPFPLGVILYFPNTALKDVSSFTAEDNMVVDTINPSEIVSDGHTSRIEILIKNDAAYQVARVGNQLKVSFDKTSTATAESTVVQETDLQADSASTTAVSAAEPAAVPASEVSAPKSMAASTPPSGGKNYGAAWMNQIDFFGEADGKSRLTIGTSVPVQYKFRKLSDRVIELRLDNTSIPWYRQRPLITTRFKSAVDRIVPYQKPEMKNYSMVTIELRESVPYVVNQMDNVLIVEFDASAIPPKPLKEADLPDWRKLISGTQVDPAASTRIAPAPGTVITESKAETALSAERPMTAVNQTGYREVGGILAASPKAYTGEKIALDFYQTDIKNVFRILREVSGKNFAIDKDVTGSVTLTLERPVPWDQVLDLVLKMNQLGMVHEQDIVRIATLSTLKKEEDLRNAQFEAAKQAREKLKALEPLVTEYIPVNYSSASGEILPHVQNILTKDRGSVTVDERNNQIILTDTMEKIRQAKEIIRRIDRVTPQVIIEARVVEVSSSFSKELGIEWNTDYGPALIDLLDVNASGNMAMNFPSESTSSIGFNFSRLTGIPWVLDAKLNAIETNGQGRILSAPKILTLDNKKAKIKQGTEFPYLERDDSGGSSVKFKDVDLLLEVTPHVTPDNRISMKVFITKNDVAAIVEGTPAVATNEAETEFLVNDGDTIVIGGIIKSNETESDSGFPVLKNIPVLGWMFKTDKTTKEDNELLIFITPRIVQLEQAEM